MQNHPVNLTHTKLNIQIFDLTPIYSDIIRLLDSRNAFVKKWTQLTRPQNLHISPEYKSCRCMNTAGNQDMQQQVV